MGGVKFQIAAERLTEKDITQTRLPRRPTPGLWQASNRRNYGVFNLPPQWARKNIIFEETETMPRQKAFNGPGIQSLKEHAIQDDLAPTRGRGTFFNAPNISPPRGPPKTWSGLASEARQCEARFSWAPAQLSPDLPTSIWNTC